MPELESGEISLSGLQIASFLLCLHMAFLLCTYLQGEREREIYFSSCSYKDTILLDEGTTLLTSFNLNYLHKGPIDKNIKGIWASTYEYGETQVYL